jgi:ribosomal-protein-alanine N-acetyltransferase
MREAVRIRSMGLADVDAVADIAAGLALAPHWGREIFLASLYPEEGPPRVALVAELAGAVRGFAVASVLAPQAELESIAVQTEAQGRGVGWELMTAMLRAAAFPGVEEMVLEVRESNVIALELYRRAGFVEAGRRRAYYLSPLEDALVMRRPIS